MKKSSVASLSVEFFGIAVLVAFLIIGMVGHTNEPVSVESEFFDLEYSSTSISMANSSEHILSPEPPPLQSTSYFNATTGTTYFQPIVGTWFEELQLDIDGAPYNTSDYKFGVFDCSNMGALLHDWLEDKGWNVKIYIGEFDGGTKAHLWLLVNGTWVDPKFKILTYDHPYMELHENIKVFESPQDLYIYPRGEFSYTQRW